MYTHPDVWLGFIHGHYFRRIGEAEELHPGQYAVILRGLVSAQGGQQARKQHSPPAQAQVRHRSQVPQGNAYGNTGTKTGSTESSS